MVIGVTIAVGDKVKKGQKLLALEAMKMETVVTAERDGEIRNYMSSPAAKLKLAIFSSFSSNLQFKYAATAYRCMLR